MLTISKLLFYVGGTMFWLGIFYGFFYVHSSPDILWLGQVFSINMVNKFPVFLFGGIVLFWSGICGLLFLDK